MSGTLIQVKVSGFLAEIPDCSELQRVKKRLITVKQKLQPIFYGRKFTKQFKHVPVKVPLYRKTKKGIFTTYGILKYLECLYGQMFEYAFEPERITIPTNFLVPEQIESSPKFKVDGKERYYFFEATKSCLSTDCGLVRLPTGSGKTEIQLTLASHLAEHVGKGIILVPTKLLLQQTLERADSYSIASKEYRKSGSKDKILISTPKVVLNDTKKGLEICNEISWLIIDECHHGKADTWLGVIAGLPNLQRVYGFSATPLESAGIVGKLGNLDLMALGHEDSLRIFSSGPMIYSKNAKDLEGFISIPKLVNVWFNWGKNAFQNKNNDEEIVSSFYNKVLQACVDNDKRNETISSIVNDICRAKRRGILFTHRKALGYKILEKCRRNPVAVWFADDCRTYSNTVDPEWIKSNFGTDSCRLIIASSHATEGLDIKIPIDTVVLLDGEGEILTLQRTGRVTRILDKKPIVINLYDMNVPILKRHSVTRMKSIMSFFGVSQEEVKFVDAGKLKDHL